MNLIGKKLTLRPLERRDLELSRSWVNNSQIAALLLRVLPVTEIEQERWFESICTSPNRMVWAIEDNSQHIGNVGLYNLDFVHRRAEAWTLIGELTKRGQGFGREAMKLLVDYGFNDLGLNKIYLHVDSENTIAIRMYKSLGFVPEGELTAEYFIQGRFKDVIRMRLLAQEWRDRNRI